MMISTAVRIVYQGEPGAYSEEAALVLFPGASTCGQRTFALAFDALQAASADVGVLPVENTLHGIVQQVNDLFWEMRGLRLVREYVHPIRHCLLGHAGSEVRRAISQPEALAQVRRYLEARHIDPVPFYDTAGAARQVAEHPEAGLAAVASRAAAERYELDILAAGIQDDDSNQTRFLVAERGEPGRPGAAQPGSKTSLCFVAAHRPGSLVEALQCFSTRGVNLTRLEARPIQDKPFEYRFFLDFQVADPALAEEALRALEATARDVRLFGTYPAFSRSVEP